MADRTTFHQFSSLTPRLQTEVAYRMDLHSLGALAQTCSAMNDIAKALLLYVKFRVESGKSQTTRLAEPPGISDLPDWTKRQLEKFVLRLTVIERFPELNRIESAKPEHPAPKRHHRSASQPTYIALDLESRHRLDDTPGPARAKMASRQKMFERLAHGISKEEILLETKTMQPLAALKLLSENFDLLLGDMGAQSADALSSVLRRVPIPGKGSPDFAPAVEAQLALLCALRRKLCARQKKSGVSKFTSTVFSGVKNFVLHCSLQRVQETEAPKFHVLIGELLRSFAFATQWDLAKTSDEFKNHFIGVSALKADQWKEIFALATSHQGKPSLSYLDLTKLEPPAPKAKVQRRAKRDPDSALTTRRKGVELMMTAPDAMKSLSENFGELLGDMGPESSDLLTNVLERAALPEAWKDDSSAAMDAHAALLRAMGKAFFTYRTDRKKDVAEFRAVTLNALRVFIVALVKSRELLSPARLQLFLGELLRCYAFGSSPAERKRLPQHPELRQLLVETGLMSEEDWKDVLQRATSRMHEPLSYLDLVAEQTEALVTAQATEIKTEHSTLSLQPLQIHESPESGKPKNKHKRSASMSAIAPMPKPDDGYVELEKGEGTPTDEADSKPKGKPKEPPKNERYDRKNCVLS